jgi:hypothetical protein
VGGLEWTEVVRRLAAAKIFWLHTTGPTAAPDAAPVRGATAGEVLYFYSERSTVKARSLERDPRVVVHLERGADLVIVHGRLVDQGHLDGLSGEGFEQVSTPRTPNCRRRCRGDSPLVRSYGLASRARSVAVMTGAVRID